MKDYYKVLGLMPSATEDEIKTAYRKLSKKFHPDMNEGDKFFEDRFKEIQEAYENLLNKSYREAFAKYSQNPSNNFQADTSANSRQTNQNNQNERPKSTTPPTSATPRQQAMPEKNNGGSFYKVVIPVIIVAVLGFMRAFVNNKQPTVDYKSLYTNTDRVASINNYTPSTDNVYVDTSVRPDTTSLTEATLPTAGNSFTGYSKEDLQNWLSLKLNQNSQNRISCPDRSYGLGSSCTHYNDYEFKLDDNYLIVKYNYDDNYDEIVYIPYYDFKSVYGSQYGSDFSISTNSRSMVELNKSTKRKSSTDYVSIGYKNDAEPDIIKNIETVLTLLKERSVRPSADILPNFVTKSDLNKPSLEETRAWILSKLRAYTASKFTMGISEGVSSEVSNLNIGMESNNLIITFNTYQFTNRVIVPLCKVWVTQPFRSYGNNMPNECTIEFRSALKIIEDYNSYSGTQYINSIQLKVEMERESDLFTRLKKAVNVLKEYCPEDSKPAEPY